MTKFDFKQWIINNKEANRKAKENKMLMEQGGGNPVPQTACDPSVTTCHAFSKCNAAHQDDQNVQNYTVSAWGNPLAFWQTLGSPTNVGQHIRVSGGTVFIYQGIQTLSLMNNGNTAPSNPQNICGCNPGCTDPAYQEYDPAATCMQAGACQNLIPLTFSECQNCCCRSNLQAKMGPGGGKRDFEDIPNRRELEENIDPTIDLSIALWEYKIEEQRRKPRSDRRSSKYFDREIEPIEPSSGFDDGDLPLDPYEDPADMTAASMSGTGVMVGPCAASHYATTSTGQPVTQGTFTPDPVHGQIDPATGICECDTGDPNNTGLSGTLYSFMNPQPGTPNSTGGPNGTGPCP